MLAWEVDRCVAVRCGLSGGAIRSEVICHAGGAAVRWHVIRLVLGGLDVRSRAGRKGVSWHELGSRTAWDRVELRRVVGREVAVRPGRGSRVEGGR